MGAEEELIEHVRWGDEAALAELHRLLAGNVRTLARRMLTDPREAEEVVQDTFVKLYRNAGRFDPERGSARAFLYTIARNLCRSRLRARSARPREAAAWDVHDPREGFTAGSRDHVTHLLVKGALEHLSEGERRLLEEAYFGGYSQSELARRHELPLGTVKSRLRRALLKLREILTEP